MAYETNGDVVMVEGTGEVFLYAGGMYYNLSYPTEMRGRKNLRRAKGPVTKITTLVGSGEVFKNAAKRAS